MDKQAWHKARQYSDVQFTFAREILEEIRHGMDTIDAIRLHPLPDGGYLAKHTLVAAYHDLVRKGEWKPHLNVLANIRMKPIRTLSGVTTVTVLTKPYPCPGECIFCPTDLRMPKSYVPDEPGARRALENNFDPYDQVFSRLEALESVGHPTDKVELLILGGTWTAYPRDYQEWFILRCFDALNHHNADNLDDAFNWNETAKHRNVGLVIETRPDHIYPPELIWLRKLGVTKVQLGAQSLDNRILEINHRGHTTEETRRAVELLRISGFKIVLHWMPNLYGATLISDRVDFARLWDGICPDEIKIYPNQLLENTDLYRYWKEGKFHPYTTDDLIDLIADVKTSIPRYCRVNRVIRDIPSTYVVEGNKRTSLRQDVQKKLNNRGEKCQCIRCREIRGRKIYSEDLRKEEIVYRPVNVEEHFLSFITTDDGLAGFLRLSLPNTNAPNSGFADLKNAAIIRELHVYGQSLNVGTELTGAAQHTGLGTRLIEWAEEIARKHRFSVLAVISAIGTRQYYLKRGFERGELYLVKTI